MAFTKGSPKPPNSGRKKNGGLLPRLDRRSIAETLAKLSCDPIEGMVLIAQDDKNRPELRGRMFAELAQYVYPKLRAIELSGPGGGPVELNVSPSELLARRIDSLAARIGTQANPPGPDRPAS